MLKEREENQENYEINGMSAILIYCKVQKNKMILLNEALDFDVY